MLYMLTTEWSVVRQTSAWSVQHKCLLTLCRAYWSGGCIAHTFVMSVTSRHLVEEWQKSDQKIVDWAVKQWHPHSEVMCPRRRMAFWASAAGRLLLITGYINQVDVLETSYFHCHTLIANKIDVDVYFSKIMCHFLLICLRVRVSKISDKTD